MGTENVFQENQEYLIKARELVTAIDDMEDELDQAKALQKRTSRSLSQEALPTQANTEPLEVCIQYFIQRRLRFLSETIMRHL